MHDHEFEEMRELAALAFGDDPQIRDLLNLLHESWAWDDELVGQVLYTHAYLDAERKLIDVLVLSPNRREATPAEPWHRQPFDRGEFEEAGRSA